LRLAFQKEK